MRRWAALALLCLLPALALGAERRYAHIEKAEISGLERAENFGILYGAQWGTYLLTQRETIRERGSFENWHKNPARPHFDFDGLSFNLIGHSIVGQFYYQYYRSRGYGEAAAFLWSVFSSSAFEFTIETTTERPSFQDLYQTPVFGSLVGMGFERLSLFFHSQEIWPARVLGYLFNPFSLLPGSHYGFTAAPVPNPKAPGVALLWRLP